MSLNYKEIDIVLSELDLSGAFIQQIVQPGYDSIALYTYSRSSQTLFICLAAGACRLHETRRKIPKNDKPLRFMEFLKSRVKGCRIQSIEQLGQERIVKLVLKNSEETLLMFIRLWSGAANIIVTEENLTILDVFFRRPKKGEVSGKIFQLPDTAKNPAQENPPAVDKPAKTFTIRDFAELKNSGIIENNAALVQRHSFDELTFSEKTDLWYSEHGKSLSKEAMLEQAQKAYTQQKNRMDGALNRLEEKRQSFLHSEQWKHQGDLILSYAHLLTEQIEQDENCRFLECTDYDTDKPIRLEIDPSKSAHENAQHYYTQYKKAISGLTELEHDIQRLKREILELETEWNLVLKEQNPVRMQQLLRKQTKPRQQIEKKHPGLSFDIEGWHILVGRTASENDELLRRHVKGHDMWMHTRDWPGGYVFIKNQRGKTVPLEILLNAGNLAVFYSKARKAKTADLYYTHVKHLRRAKNAPKGTVLPTNEKNLTVTLDNERLKKMETSQND